MPTHPSLILGYQNDCLRKLQHLVVDISRLRVETSYEEKRGGFGDVQVSTLDADTPTPKLVVAKTIRLRARTQQPQRVAFVRQVPRWYFILLLTPFVC